MSTDPAAAIDYLAPQISRVRAHLAGLKDSYELDRRLAERIAEAHPHARAAVRVTAGFHWRATEVLARSGVAQFLDLAAGYEPIVRRAAHGVNPAARVAYVDRDPVVLAHGRACVWADDGAAWVDAEPTDISRILDRAELDLAEPVAVSLVGAVEYLDQAASVAAVRELLAALAPGSALVMSATTADLEPDRIAEVERVYERDGIRFHARTLAEFGEHFAGLALVEPGIVPPHHWDSPPVQVGTLRDADISSYAAVARKR